MAFVVDDVLPPWQPRLIEIRGEAVRREAGGDELSRSFSGELIRISPRHVVAYGIDEIERRWKVGGRDVDPAAPVRSEIYLQDHGSRMDSLERRVAEASNQDPCPLFEVPGGGWKTHPFFTGMS